MRDCEIKSTGTLVDELLTLDLKIKAGIQGAEERRHELGNVIIERTAILIIQGHMDIYREFQKVQQELAEVLEKCWNAQEIVMNHELYDEWGEIGWNMHIVAHAAKLAQLTNAQRNRLIRQLDELVNETERTQLAKSYDKS